MRSEDLLIESVKEVLRDEFKDEHIERVIDSFSNAVAGRILERDGDTPAHQRATSFIEGLDTSPFIDEFSGDYEWVNYLESNWTRIRDELIDTTADNELAEKGNNIWAPPVVEAASAYGPEWRTLVLQDRVWDPINTKLFPVTTKILKDKVARVPSVECFFARQSPNTGIKLHTDDCNFILTMHLGLSVPSKKSWIEVGGEKRYWEEGKALVFNTSFYHETMNESDDEDRVVLLLRFWHPQLSMVERRALQYLFELIDDPESNPAVVKSMAQLMKQTDEKPQKRRSKSRDSRHASSSGRGFGKKS